MGTIEKSVNLNLLYYILKFGNIWITYFRSLDFRVVPLPEQEFPRDKKLQVRECGGDVVPSFNLSCRDV